MRDKIFKGDVYIVKLPEQTDCSVETGVRPVVVVSSNIGCRTADIVMVCPITTRLKRLSCNVDISWTLDNRPSQVLCNQIMTIPKDLLQYYKGYIPTHEIRQIERAIMLSLGIRGGEKVER